MTLKYASSNQNIVSSDFDMTPFIPLTGLNLVENGKGTCNIPHRIFEWMVKVTETKVDLIVLGCMVRFSLGFQRPWCETSQTFIARWTRLAVPNVRRAIKSLLGQGIIVRLKDGTLGHESAIYEVPIVAAYLRHIEAQRNTGIPDQSAEIKSISDQIDLSLNQAEISDQIDPRSEIKLIPKKERIKKEKETLSQAELPETIRNYFQNLKSEKKRKREWAHFLSLRRDFSAQDISDALFWLLNQGASKEGKVYHSPMAYLAMAITDVLNAAQAFRKKEEKSEEVRRQREAVQDNEKERAEKLLEDFRAREVAFERSFADMESQRSYIALFARNYPMLKSTGVVVRNLAISSWATH